MSEKMNRKALVMIDIQNDIMVSGVFGLFFIT